MHRLALLVAVVGTSTLAHANVEIGGTAGVHIFSESNALGVPTNSPNPTSESNTALFGIRLGAYFNQKIGVELELGLLPDEPRSMVFDLYNITYRANLVYQFRTENDDNAFIPFVLGGAGEMQLISSKNQDIVRKDHNYEVYVGGGVKYRASGNWGLRFDLRVIGTSKQPSGLTEDFEGLLSLYKEFGRAKPTEKKVAPPPPVDDDPDKDGIHGAADKCPNEPEDKDGFQDEDGCPDPDNDGDGILDAVDKCPLEPEDKDGFQDEDGCPDPDNDNDSILDVNDKCPNEPETRNGYMDGDGCPDEIPEKLKRFTGVIQGINFKLNSAELLPNSYPILDKALAVLVEFKDVKLEIQGHTDDQPLVAHAGSKFMNNQDLSQGRAESVREYFVKKGVEESRLIAKGYGDTAPIDDPKGLKGQKLNAARSKNRRVEFKLIANPGVMVPIIPPPAPTPPPATPPATPTP